MDVKLMMMMMKIFKGKCILSYINFSHVMQGHIKRQSLHMK